LIWIPHQLEDWGAAVEYARHLEMVDPKKIALWGTSLSGGHVIVTAAKDHEIVCVAAQCPGLDGRASAEMGFETAGMGKGLRLIMHGQRDLVRSWLGLSPHKIPIVGKSGSIALMTTENVFDFFEKAAPDGYVNEACARILIRADKYRPVKHAPNVRCPVLLQICDHDSIIPASAVRETEKNLGEHAEVKHYPIGHFDIYKGRHFEQAVSDQLDFFQRHL
jgi:dienelactone hydrolase